VNEDGEYVTFWRNNNSWYLLCISVWLDFKWCLEVGWVLRWQSLYHHPLLMMYRSMACSCKCVVVPLQVCVEFWFQYKPAKSVVKRTMKAGPRRSLYKLKRLLKANKYRTDLTKVYMSFLFVTCAVPKIITSLGV